MESRSIKSIGILVSGTLLAHVITCLAMPVNTRLFSPDDFTVLSVFAGIVGIITPIACLRLDAAIILPESDEDAVNLLALSLCALLLVTSLVGTLFYITPNEVIEKLRLKPIEKHLWVFPLTTFITGFYIVMQAWYVRSRKFPTIAASRSLQATTSVGVQLSSGYLGFGSIGLICGFALNYGVGFCFLLCRFMVHSRSLLKAIEIWRMKRVLKMYEQFPRYSIWEALANGLSNSAPVVIIASITDNAEAGYLNLALFVLQAPLALLGNSIGQVFISDAPSAFRESRLGAYTTTCMFGLLKIGTGPMLFIALLAPHSFAIVFGDNWTRSGVLVSWMVPWFYLQFLASPICNAIHVTNNQRAMMIFHIGGAVFRVGSVIVAGIVAKSYVAEVWAITGCVFYAAYIKLILDCVGVSFKTFFVGLALSWRITLLCAIATLPFFAVIVYLNSRF